MKSLIITFAAISLAACGSSPSGSPNEQAASSVGTTLIYDIPSMVGMSKEAIDVQWGEPNCPPKNSCEYGDKLTVYFVEGRAANFTLPPVDDVRAYGFSVGAPSFENTGVTRWNVDIGGLGAEISSFEDNFVYVSTVNPSEVPTSW
ncbi:hypothetical protein [Stakelama tenebrarum]|uniref:Uncharacterized protein n=1 Tax=Stakelama tenebrarum TaxID=2711215 RepID=A0A6G6Y649_9SPHN|nr:hypothetical protein [Sphingosinithalassobacter tenebrarum]QIG80198.1 hypothetical protein G5C33_10675 [Sphingosinithalassobacter tenebrarum]